jgi:hypothetical protein
MKFVMPQSVPDRIAMYKEQQTRIREVLRQVRLAKIELEPKITAMEIEEISGKDRSQELSELRKIKLGLRMQELVLERQFRELDEAMRRLKDSEAMGCTQTGSATGL